MISLFQKLALITCSLAVFLLASGCGGSAKKPKETNVSNNKKVIENKTDERTLDLQSEPFGKTSEGIDVTQYLLSNSNGVSVGLMNLGATVTSVYLPDRGGKSENVVLNWNDLAGFEKGTSYFGSICGRYANRIAKGKFSLDGKEYQLATNNDPNHLHGGDKGFNRHVWLASEIQEEDVVGVKFTMVSDDGEEGYPGSMNVNVTYTLNKQNELKIEYLATTDKPTVVNLTNHCYWNLAGANSGTMLDQLLTLNCEEYLEVDDTLIPTGKRLKVSETEMDFLTPHPIGERISKLKIGGYDHCYIVKGSNSEKPVLAAKVEDTQSGRVMEVFTTEPGIQLYSSIHLDGSETNNNYPQYAAFCLEAQHFPDSPNHPDFPSTVLRPEQVYHQITIHRFSVNKSERK